MTRRKSDRTSHRFELLVSVVLIVWCLPIRITYAYNANGNLTSKTDASGSWTYTWDYENRLKQATKTGGVSVTYLYDALGRRIQRTSSGSGTTKFVYDGADVVRDLDGSGATIADYLNGPGIDNKLRQTISGTASYFLVDHLGTTRSLADSGGTITSNLNYDSFGNVTSGSASTRYTYTGRELDSETGLMYYRARWYDPQLGRFVSEDPIGFEGGDVNLYAYVENEPLNFGDPRGLERLNYVLRPGTPAPPVRTNPVRLPDFYSGQLNIGLGPAVPLGWSGQVILDRQGHLYLQLLGLNLGKSATVVSVAGTVGWISQRCEPDEDKLNAVLSDQSIGVGGGFIGGIEFTGNQSGSTTQVGIMSPQIGGSWGSTSNLGDLGSKDTPPSSECGCREEKK